MNKKFFWGFGIPALLVCAVALLSFKGYGEHSPAEHSAAVAPGMAPAADLAEFAGSSTYKAYGADTLANATKDTLAIPYTFASRYSYSVHFTLATISGTRAMKIYLDESNALSGSTGWVAVDSITPTATVNEYMMEGAEVWGRKQRLRVSGNTGATQSVRYVASVLYKPLRQE